MFIGSNIIEVAKLLKAYKYTGTSFSDAITPSSLAQSRSKLKSNTGPSKGKQKASLENVSYPDDGKHIFFFASLFYFTTHAFLVDAWPIGKRLDHIIQFLEMDEWKQVGNPNSLIKESKLEKLETLIRILKNTTGIDAYCPKKKLIIWYITQKKIGTIHIHFFYSLRQCIVSPNREIRIMALRALRLLVEGPNDVEIMMIHQIDIFSTR